MDNIQHSTFNIQRPTARAVRVRSCLMLNAESSIWKAVLCFLLAAPVLVHAQTPPHLPPGGLIQLQVAQPGVDVSSPVSATAAFDPPMVRPGDKTLYRVNINATESSITWPDDLAAPEKLIFSPKARGMITEMQANSFRPLTAFVYEVQTTETGHFAVTNFSVDVSGVRVEIPAASLDVATNASPEIQPQLALQISDTNVFLGQPFRVQVMLPAGPGNQIEAVRSVVLNQFSHSVPTTLTTPDLRSAIQAVEVL